jgi:UDP-N-acetylmuramate dehydrogenase
MEIYQQLKNEFPRLETDVSLKDYSTFRIGGPAKYFLRTSDKNELKNIIARAAELNIPFRVLGGGSNTLIDENGFDGLVLVYGVKDVSKEKTIMEKKENPDGFYMITVNAATPLFFLINQLNDFTGLEWAAGIPGTIGGAINGNAGAMGESISDIVEAVEALDVSAGNVEEKEIKKKGCLFGYRSSFFKDNPEIIIVSAVLKMAKGDREEIKKRIAENIGKRTGKQPKGFSIGSIFKNYEGYVDEETEKSFPDLKIFREKGIISAGFLIEKCGLKGKIIGGAKISEEHGNFIINFDNARSEDVIGLINLIKKSVKEKFSIDLKEEIKFLGAFAIDK